MRLMMKSEQPQRLVKGALLLTLAGFIGKILSAGYRIPLQNLTGDTGFYMYQQVYPVLGTAMMLALYGFPAAVSKLAVEYEEKNQSIDRRSLFCRVWFVLLLINSLLFFLLHSSADQLALIADDPMLATGYRMTAYVFLLVPFTASLRGLLQAHGDMRATAYSQIVEQFARAMLIILGALMIAINDGDRYVITQIAPAAQMISAVAAIFVLAMFWKKTVFASEGKQHRHKLPWGHVFKVLGGFGLLTALNHMILILIQAVDMISLVGQLHSFGLTDDDAIVAKGIFDRGQPLIQLGTVLGSSFALGLVPTITKHALKRNSQSVGHGIHRALGFSFYLAGGATIGLVMIFPETNLLLYENSSGTSALRVLTLALLLSSVAITGMSILQGAGFMKWTAALIIGTGLVKWFGNHMLVPKWGIMGSALATVIALALLTLAMLVLLYRKIPGIKFSSIIHWQAFVTSGVGMTIFLGFAKLLTPFGMITSRLVLAGCVIGLVTMGAGIYITGLIRFGALDDDDISMLPFASHLMKLRKG